MTNGRLRNNVTCLKEHPLRTPVISNYLFPGWLEFACQHLDQFGSEDRCELECDAVLASLRPACARIKADAFPQQYFTSRLTCFGQLMGRKQVKSGDPAEKSDRDVLEVLLDLEPAAVYPLIGLRVTVQFLRQHAIYSSPQISLHPPLPSLHPRYKIRAAYPRAISIKSKGKYQKAKGKRSEEDFLF